MAALPPDMTKKHHATAQLRKDGTGLWFLEGDKFIEWYNNPGLLWIEGHSGAGKSVLCSAVISQLIADEKPFQATGIQRRSPAMAYFYFDFRYEETQNVEIALRHIILQLSAQCPDPYKCLDSHYAAGRTLPSYKDLQKIIPELLRELGRTYIIMDALDECDADDHDRLVELISTFRQWTETPLHIFFTSQTREIFTTGFKGVPNIALKYSVTHEDIRLFVRTQIQSNHKYKIWRPHVDRITEDIAHKSDGMFRLADCLLTEVSRCRYPSQLETTLKNLPTTLFDVYDRFLDAVSPPEDLVYVTAALRWIMFAAREITLAQLADAISFDFSNPDQYTHEPDRRESNASAIFDWLEGLVAKSTKSAEWDKNTYVVLAHSSVQEYTTSTHFRDKFNCALSEESSHAFIARTCISYFLGFSNHPLPDDTAPADPLSQYAAWHWLHHMIPCDAETGLFSQAMQVFEEGSEQYKALCRSRENPILSWELPRLTGSPLHICSDAGYIKGVQALLTTCTNIDLMPDEYGTALTIACAKDRTNIVALLLQKGADPNILSSHHGSALAVACMFGYIEIVRLLVDSGANVNLLTSSFGSALSVTFRASSNSSSSSSIEIARLLLDSGADINTGALGAACESDNIESVRFLVEHGADINQPGGYYGSALGRASFRGTVDVIRFLLESGADVNLPGGKFGSPLGCACHGGQAASVRLLLESGADINLSAGDYGSVLGAAVSFLSPYRVDGYLKIVHLLFEHGADVKRHGNPALKLAMSLDFKGYRDANYAAELESARLRIIHLLQEKGVVLDSENEVETGGAKSE
ncbi:ankyrin repeat-containing domain protein [Mycena vulgaris]|nr:ankyrin repeat-containing domain protein [Mycena vulgaris]